MNAAERLLAAGADDAVALVEGEVAITRGALRRQVDQREQTLRSAGMGPGDRVLVAADNSVDTVVDTLAILRAGGVVASVPPSLSPARLTAIADDLQARFALGAHEILAEAPSIAAVARATGAALELVRDAAPAPASAELAVIQYTSGSTAEARGVMVGHRELVANAAGIAAALELGPTDRGFLVLPLHYCFGASVLTSHLISGGSVVLGGSAAFAEAVVDGLAASGATAFYGVPSGYQVLLGRSGLAQRSLPRLRLCAQAGGKLADGDIRALRAIACAPAVFIMYGQTEATARLSVLPSARLDDALGSIGRGLPDGTRIWIGDATGAPLPAGEEGEVWASGPAIARGYWGDPAASASHFVAGRLRTGDRGVASDEGLVWLRGRDDDFVKVAGVRVAPAEVEEVVRGFPEVLEVAVDAVADRLTGQALRAHIVLREGATLDARTVATRCRQVLPAEKVPRSVVFHDALPRTSSGKLDRPALAAATGSRPPG